jgi:outer membrane protein
MKKTAFALFFAALAATAAVGQATPAQPQLLKLSLKRAVEIATSPEGSTRIVFALEALRQARARSAQSFAAFLPDVESSVGQRNMNVNLAANGFTSIKLPFGFAFPSIVGPFNVFDARATATMSIFAYSDIIRYQASKAGVRAAEADRSAANDDVSAQVARAYLVVQRADAALLAADADVALAEQVVKEAQDEKDAGMGTGIEVTRARVQLLNDKQRQLIARNDRHRALLQLLRAMNVPLDVPVELEGRLRYQAEEKPELEQARKTAFEHRYDLKAQLERQETARLTNSATTYERLPSVAGFADYGSIGSSINHAFPTRTYGLSVKVPIFDGGRRDERRVETQSQLRQAAASTQDLRQQIELDIRLALDSLDSAADQVKVAEEALGLAESELAQARRRNAAGVSSGIEVTDAQTRLARARDNQVAALYGYNLARLELAQATGTIRQFVQ